MRVAGSPALCGERGVKERLALIPIAPTRGRPARTARAARSRRQRAELTDPQRLQGLAGRTGAANASSTPSRNTDSAGGQAQCLLSERWSRLEHWLRAAAANA